MNILYLCADPGVPIRGHKGAAVHVRALTDAFAALGHQVTLLTPRAGPADGQSPAATLVEVPALVLSDGMASAQARERAASEVAEAVYRAARDVLAHEHFDFIYERYSLWSDAGARLARESGLPLVVEVNAPLRIEAARYRILHNATGAAEIEANLLAAASAVAVVSGPLREYLIDQGIDPDRVHVLPNAVDERRFHPAVDGTALRANLGLAQKSVIGFVGTVKPWHDLDTLITAVAQLHAHDDRYHLLLIGDIPQPVRVTIAQRGLADATTIVGPVPHTEVPLYLAAMDVAVSPHPPLADFYFSPLKLFEYLACGVATIAADVPPIAEVIENGMTGLLYPPGDADALAGQIAVLATDLSARTHLGWQGASQVLRHHTWRGNAQQIIGWLFPAAQPAVLDAALPLFDDKLRRRLFRATRADVAGPLLAAHLPASNGTIFNRVTRLEVLKYKPRRRCVIAYELAPSQATTDHPRTCGVIGKVFRDERGAQHFALHQALWAEGFGREAADAITIAEPLAYIPEMRMFVQERAPGRTLDEFLGAPDFADRVRRSAAAIAKVHTSDIRPPGKYPLEAELDNLERFAADLAAWRPDRAPAFARQLARLRAWAGTLPPAELVPAHRDFYYSQVLFADPRVTLIDLDMFALADPAIDVANFAAHLRFLALQRLPDPGALDAAAAWFVDEYARQRAPAPGFFARLAFYQAATFFRLMHVALQRPHFAQHIDRLFDICEGG